MVSVDGVVFKTQGNRNANIAGTCTNNRGYMTIMADGKIYEQQPGATSCEKKCFSENSGGECGPTVWLVEFARHHNLPDLFVCSRCLSLLWHVGAVYTYIDCSGLLKKTDKVAFLFKDGGPGDKSKWWCQTKNKNCPADNRIFAKPTPGTNRWVVQTDFKLTLRSNFKACGISVCSCGSTRQGTHCISPLVAAPVGVCRKQVEVKGKVLKSQASCDNKGCVKWGGSCVDEWGNIKVESTGLFYQQSWQKGGSTTCAKECPAEWKDWPESPKSASATHAKRRHARTHDDGCAAAPPSVCVAGP